jgi:hypothetical protein
MYLTVKKYDNGKPILYGLNSMRAPFGASIKAADLQADIDGQKTVPEGSFLVAVGDKVRFLPRARAATAVVTTLPTVTLKGTSQNFLPGDVLHVVGGYAEVTFSGAIAAADTVALKIGDSTYAVTSAGAAFPALVTAFIAANSAALLAQGITVTQKGSSGTMVIVSDDSHAINYSASNGSTIVTINSTEAGFLGDNIIPLGTIASVGPIAANGQRVITLLANAAYNVPVSVPVGVMVKEFLGIYNLPIDLTLSPKEHIAPIVEADGVYEQNLPYIDAQLKRRFANLRIFKRFYKSVA